MRGVIAGLQIVENPCDKKRLTVRNRSIEDSLLQVPLSLRTLMRSTYRLLQCSWSKNGSFFGGELKGPQARDLKRDESLRISFITVSKSLQTSYDYGFSTCDR
ncbi:hypothetical protein Y032_0095g2786 [Ancylostoma ceylanicum]|uniref:Uncharacterized protein n=1 Tax=Ancylostoma ceylanicum TaxID=53326 RepID=A0A016TKA6_9BILA|nr:hypothetical protein Y032_0095g2786 [Ancylostoma ceylanicum]